MKTVKLLIIFIFIQNLDKIVLFIYNIKRICFNIKLCVLEEFHSHYYGQNKIIYFSINLNKFLRLL